MVDLNEVTLGSKQERSESDICKEWIGKYVIIRTYSAGVHAGFLFKKSGNEVILKNSRRLWAWHTKQGISLSSIATYGIEESKSKICEQLDFLWLEAIEIIPTKREAFDSISNAQVAKAE